MKRVVAIRYTLQGKQFDDDFIVLDLDDKYDVILGMPWLKHHEPKVDWTSKSISFPPSSRAHSMTCDSRAPNGAHASISGDGPIEAVPTQSTAVAATSLNVARGPSSSHQVRAQRCKMPAEPQLCGIAQIVAA
jgi:hypothetical protein